MCCDGTLFTVVRLVADEPARMRALALPVIDDAMPQRCAALAGRDCTIYEDRPAQCAAFECLLAIAHRAGEVSLEEAQAVVRDTRAAGATPELLRRHFLGRTFSP